MKTLQLDHVALHVADVDASCRFYRDVLQLKSLPRPAFDFPGAWFRLGSQQELHLIGDRTEAVHSHNRGNHFALMVDDIDAWEAHLDANTRNQESLTSEQKRVMMSVLRMLFFATLSSTSPQANVIRESFLWRPASKPT